MPGHEPCIGDKATVQKSEPAQVRYLYQCLRRINWRYEQLHWAAFHSDKEMVDLLIGAGANPKAANREGSTLAASGEHQRQNAAIIEALLKGGADPNEKLPLGRSPLMLASRTGNIAAMMVRKSTMAPIVNRRRKWHRGTTPLMWSCRTKAARACYSVADRRHGANVKAQSDSLNAGRGPALGKSTAIRDDRRSPGKARLWPPDRHPRLWDRIAATQTVLGEQRGPDAWRALGAAAPGRRWAAGEAVEEAEAGLARMPRLQAPIRARTSRMTAARRLSRFRREGRGAAEAAAKGNAALTPLVYAVRSAISTLKSACAAGRGANGNQVTGYGWATLLVATQNCTTGWERIVIDHGADVNLRQRRRMDAAYQRHR